MVHMIVTLVLYSPQQPESEESFDPQKEKLGSWAQCSLPICNKWRYLKTKVDPNDIPERWVCSMNPGQLIKNYVYISSKQSYPNKKYHATF